MAGLQSAARVIQTVEFLAARGTARLDDVAKVLEIHKSNALRLLSTLREFRWVEVDTSRSEYSLGPRLVSVGEAAVAGLGLQKAWKVAEGLRDLTGESVDISIPVGHRMLIVGHVESRNPLKVLLPIGTEDFLHSSAVGKVYLATLPDHELESLVDELKLIQVAPSTITSAEALIDHIRIVREHGYATNYEEAREGTAAIAVALNLGSGPTVAALSITGPIDRFTPDVIDSLAPDILGLVAPYQALSPSQRGIA